MTRKPSRKRWRAWERCLAAPESEEPITDAELDEIKESDGMAISRDQAVRLVAEIRRLRSSSLLADDDLDAIAEGDPGAMQRLVELARRLLGRKRTYPQEERARSSVDREERAELQRLRSDEWLAERGRGMGSDPRYVVEPAIRWSPICWTSCESTGTRGIERPLDREVLIPGW